MTELRMKQVPIFQINDSRQLTLAKGGVGRVEWGGVGCGGVGGVARGRSAPGGMEWRRWGWVGCEETARMGWGG